MASVSVVLLNWNGDKYIKNCIESVLNQTIKSQIEFIIVDNGSSDGSFDYLKELQGIKLIANETNLGFARGINIGIEAATGDHILILNLDVYLKPDYLQNALKIFKRDERIACVGGVEYAWRDEGFVNINLDSGGPYFLRKRMQVLVGQKQNLNVEQECFGVTGSLPVFRKKAIDELISVSGHFFDPDFETGWEDTDVRFRLFWLGWKTHYSPELIGWHVGSGSANGKIKLIDKPYEYQKRIFRNRSYVIKKLPRQVKKKLLFYLLLTNVLITPYYLFVSPNSLLAFFESRIDVFKARKILSQNKTNIESNLRVNPLDIMKFFIKF